MSLCTLRRVRVQVGRRAQFAVGAGSAYNVCREGGGLRWVSMRFGWRTTVVAVLAACAPVCAWAAEGPVDAPATPTPTAAPTLPALDDGESNAPVGRRLFDTGKLRADMGAYLISGYEYRRDSTFNIDDYDSFGILAAAVKGTAAWELGRDVSTRMSFDMDFGTGVFLSRNIFATIAYKSKLVAFDIGQMKVPFLLYEMTPENVRQILPSASIKKIGMGRDRGARLRGELALGDTQLRWWTGIFHGEGPSVLKNVDNRYVYTGRVQWIAVGKLTDSESDLEGGPLRLGVGASAMYTASLAHQELGQDDLYLKELRTAADFALKIHGFSLRAEYIHGDVKAGDLTDGFTRHAFWASAGYVLPLDLPVRLEPVARVLDYDFNSAQDGFVAQQGGPPVYGPYEYSRQRKLDVGLNIYLAERRLWLNLVYRTVRFLEGQKYDSDGGPLIGDQFTAYLHLGFP